MLRVARLTYGKHYRELTDEQRAGLIDLAADIQSENEQIRETLDSG